MFSPEFVQKYARSEDFSFVVDRNGAANGNKGKAESTSDADSDDDGDGFLSSSDDEDDETAGKTDL